MIYDIIRNREAVRFVSRKGPGEMDDESWRGEGRDGFRVMVIMRRMINDDYEGDSK